MQENTSNFSELQNVVAGPRDGWPFTYWWMGRLQMLCQQKNESWQGQELCGLAVYSKEIFRLRDDVMHRRQNALTAFAVMQRENPELAERLISYGFRLMHRGYEAYT